MSKSDFGQDEKEKAVESLFYCALTFRAPLKTFEDIKSYLLKFTPAELIFQKFSTEYLWITKALPKKEVKIP